MTNEKLPFVNELCYLAKLRNDINTRRHRARFRKNYYANALRVLEAHNNSNFELRSLRSRLEAADPSTAYGAMDCSHLNSRIDQIEKSMLYLRNKHPKPTKWKAMGLHKLRSLILLGEAEYAQAKHETMEFSIKHRSRVKYLVSVLDCSVHYDNGAINLIRFKSDGDFFDLECINHHAELYELDKAVTTMVEE